MALTEGAKQLIWLRRALQELGFEQNQPTSDNIGVAISQDATCSKHINISYHINCEKVASNDAALTYVLSKLNPADIMTKGLDLEQYLYLCQKLEMETP